METVTRAQMALIRSLATAKGRRETGLFVAEGPKLIDELLQGGLQCELLAKSGENISQRDFEKISSQKSPQGVIAAFRIPRHELLDTSGLILALDGVQDPGNMGTILRLADWYGVDDVVCSLDSASAWQPKVVQASMGALARVRVHRLDLAEWLDTLPQGKTVMGTFLDGDRLGETPLPSSGVLLMGNEGNGISEIVAQRVTKRIFIPPYPPHRRCVESLNVATATAIILSRLRGPKN